MIFTPFEKLYVKDKTMLDVREKYWIFTKDIVKKWFEYKCLMCYLVATLIFFISFLNHHFFV